MENRKTTNERGFSLTELITVVTIIAVMATFATISAREWMITYQVESTTRTMHADLMQARALSLQRYLTHFVVVTTAPSTYSIYEDKNASGGTGPDAGDGAPLSTSNLKYPATAAITLVIDQRGLVSTVPATPDDGWPANIFFNTAGISPEYDCIQLYPTRISIGKKNGGDCVAK